MKIIITAVGQGSRFENIGIKKPKYQIVANGKSLFYWSIYSLKNFFDNEFILIFRKDIYDDAFVKNELNKLGNIKYKIVIVEKMTNGQASTALLANSLINDEEDILIFNIDTLIDPNSLKKEMIAKNDGCIVVTQVSGDHWSFAKLGKNGFVEQVSEKIRISDYSSVGLYYFNKWKDFKWVYNNFNDEIKNQYKEVYVCPMYQYLINNNKQINIFEINKNSFTCLGTPQEIEMFDNNWLNKNK